MRNSIKTILTVWIATTFVVPSVDAQSKLSTVFRKKYSLRSVSCNTCHVKGEEKSVLNPFGKKIDKLVEGMHVTERLEAAKQLDIEEQDRVAEEIEKEFLVVLKKLDTMKAPSGKTYAEVIAAGELAGTKVRK